MAILTPQSATLTGAVITFDACAGGGDSFPNQGRTSVLIRNGSGGNLTVTADCPNPDNFGVSGSGLDAAVIVPTGATTDFAWGPFSPARFNDANGRVQLTYSGVTSLSIAVLSR